MSNHNHQKHRKVEHNYQDNAGATEKESEDANKPVNASDKNFPVRLHFMLNELEADGLSHIISWQPHGRCFLVHQQDEFVKQILPM